MSDKNDNDFTIEEHKRYAELLRFFSEVEPSEYFDLQVEFVALRDKAISLGLDVDLLPF